MCTKMTTKSLQKLPACATKTGGCYRGDWRGGQHDAGEQGVDSTVRKLEKRRSSNLRDYVGSTPARATGVKETCVGWALVGPSGCNPPASELCRFGHRSAWMPDWSLPGALNTARSSNGRMRDPHSRDTSSTLVRVTDIAKWRNWNTRDAQNVVSMRTCEFDSRLGY